MYTYCYKLHISSVSPPPPMKILSSRPCQIYFQQRGVASKCMSDVKKFNLQNILRQGFTNPGLQFATATPFCTILPDICAYSVCNLRHVSLLATRNLRWLLEICKICAPCTKVKIQQPCCGAHMYQDFVHLHQNASWRQQVHTHTHTHTHIHA